MGKTIDLYGFASAISEEELIQFLEEYTGKGSVEAVKVRKAKKEGSRVGAKVQFRTDEDAERILSWSADQALWHQSSFLKAKTLNHDIIAQPKSQTFNLQSIDNLMLHFGCQVSKEKFYALWSQGDASMKYGLKLDRLYFCLSYNSVEYKLELFEDNVWQIVLHHSQDQTKFLVIQLLGAPRIYVKDVSIPISSSDATDDEQWIREVDFTPGSCIGQSFALCLELPRGVRLPKFSENYYFKQVKDKFCLEIGSTFSSNPDLVPIITPPQSFELPYSIFFKVNSLVQHGCLSAPTLDAKFFELVDPSRNNIAFIESALEKLYSVRECCYEPVKELDEQYKQYKKSEKPPKPPLLTSDGGLVAIRRVQVTPSKVYFSGPELNLSNRVVRSYLKDIDNFLRVSFVDEELGKIRSTDLSSSTSAGSDGKHTRIYDRILSTLRNGLVIGDKKFEFLACSTSQLRENSVWMFAAKPGFTAADIREKMGHFHAIKNVAKFAARLGQSLSSSRETLEVKMNEVDIIPDIDNGTKYTFSDGIGKVSEKHAKAMARKIGLSFTPSAYQIRYGGYKGVVAVDPSSSTKLSLRKSMQKYDADSTSLDVLAWSKYQPCYLNRQIIILMSTLGVKDIVFEKKQKLILDQLDAILLDPERAREAMEWISHGEITRVLRGMLMSGYNKDSEPFLSMMLQTIRASKLLDLRTKTRIFVQKGRAMMGCLDETGTLEYGQVFVQYSVFKPVQFSETYNDGGQFRKTHVVEGKVVVAKNPCLHPGDLRVLEAVDAVVLHHMVDCIVFPQKGHRPHPNECSGSDLDGDVYFVCWDEDLIPTGRFPPMDYDPAPSSALDHDVTIEEVAEYFTNYILNDSLGVISNAHTAFADKEPYKAMSEPCIELAKLSSIAVDFPKTGIPAKIPHRLRVQQYPDFMEKPHRLTYESQSVIGKLYREVKALAAEMTDPKKFTREVAEQCYDPEMEVDGFLAYVNNAFQYKSSYDEKLANLMRTYGVKTEAEMISGCIMKMSKSFDRRKDMETVILAVKKLRKEAKDWFNEKGDDDQLDYNFENVLAKASAWYHVTYHPEYWGCYSNATDREHFISFPWCIYDKLLQIKQENKGRRPSNLPSVETQVTLSDDESHSDQKTGWLSHCSLM